MPGEPAAVRLLVLADYGTRLKADFNNIPTGVRIFVSTANVLNNNFPAPAPSPSAAPRQQRSGAQPTTAPLGYAQLVNGETTSDGNAGVAGFFPVDHRNRQRTEQR